MKHIIGILAFVCCGLVHAQEIINLYPDAIPNSKPSGRKETFTNQWYRNVTTPTLEIYRATGDRITQAAVVICPGGGYTGLAFGSEGVRTAKEFAQNGITAFVLKYRLPDDSIMIDKTIGPLQDAQQAIKLVRDNAEKWNLDKNKIGIMGFSAGGHLASTEATHYTKALIPNESGTSLRPDFLILIYPVISMKDSLTHMGSRNSLLGRSPSKELVDLYSNELQVNENTPPTYLTHTGDDTLVDVDNSISFYEALRHNKVPAELHLYPRGGHGFVLSQPVESWMTPLLLWMQNLGVIGK